MVGLGGVFGAAAGGAFGGLALLWFFERLVVEEVPGLLGLRRGGCRLEFVHLISACFKFVLLSFLLDRIKRSCTLGLCRKLKRWLVGRGESWRFHSNACLLWSIFHGLISFEILYEPMRMFLEIVLSLGDHLAILLRFVHRRFIHFHFC